MGRFRQRLQQFFQGRPLRTNVEPLNSFEGKLICIEIDGENAEDDVSKFPQNEPKITITVNAENLQIADSKTGDTIVQHDVDKISLFDEDNGTGYLWYEYQGERGGQLLVAIETKREAHPLIEALLKSQLEGARKNPELLQLRAKNQELERDLKDAREQASSLLKSLENQTVKTKVLELEVILMKLAIEAYRKEVIGLPVY